MLPRRAGKDQHASRRSVPRAAFLAWGLACGLAAAAACPPASAAPAATAAALDTTRFLPVSGLHPGERAVCRTVFAGRTIEEFEVEIVGILPGGRVDGDMILARALGPRLQHDGVAAGMSGSPVYVDGRLIGALAFGWSFSRDPLFGITPIADMLGVMDQPDRAAVGAFDSGPAWTQDGGADHQGGMPGLRTPLVVSGLTEAARAELAPWAERHGLLLVPGGVARAAGADGGTPARLGPGAARAALVPGAAISLDLVRGDLNASAIGTLTWRDGDRVVAFGHPMFLAGDVSYPLGLADITTIVASDLNSFKLGVPGEQVGTITQDRQAAIAGRIGGVASMMPVAVTIAGPAGLQRYHFEILKNRFLAPQLASTVLLNAVMAHDGGLPEATWRYRLALYARGHAPLVVEDVGTGAVNNVTAAVAQPLRLLLNNPFAAYQADSLTFQLELAQDLSRAQLWSARVEPRTVRPGGTARVYARLRDYRGGFSDLAFDLRVPEDQPDGTLVLAVGAGPELDHQEAERLPGRHRALSLAQLLDRLDDRRRADRVYVALYGAGLEPTIDGAPYPELPRFAERLLASDRSNRPAAPWGRIERLDQAERGVGVPVAGLVTLRLDVRRHPPGLLAPRADDGGAAARWFDGGEDAPSDSDSDSQEEP